MHTLLQKESIDLLLANQYPNGAYIAGPDFSQYRFCWIRDSCYIAYSLMLYDEEASTYRFLCWAMEAIQRNEDKILSLPTALEKNQKLGKQAFLGARFTLEGMTDNSDWPNFQPDGYGTLLWLLSKYMERQQMHSLPENWKNPVLLTIQYLETVWKLPSSDCWEEFPDKNHLSTLACLAGGLKAITTFLPKKEQATVVKIVHDIKTYIIENGTQDGYFHKFIGSSLVDASLIWLATPYQVFEANDPLMLKTLALVERNLLHQGGTQRYSEDTYYGGGLWIPLSGFLGWHYLALGRVEEARQLLAWMERQRTKQGFFPEQVTTFTNDPTMVTPWEKRWGTIASPLLWSHAMFLILDFEIMQYNAKGE